MGEDEEYGKEEDSWYPIVKLILAFLGLVFVFSGSFQILLDEFASRFTDNQQMLGILVAWVLLLVGVYYEGIKS